MEQKQPHTEPEELSPRSFDDLLTNHDSEYTCKI